MLINGLYAAENAAIKEYIDPGLEDESDIIRHPYTIMNAKNIPPKVSMIGKDRLSNLIEF